MTMRKLIMTAAAAAALLSPLAATSASAQPYGYGYRGGYDDRVQHEVRECHRDLRRADNRWEYERARRDCGREIAQARRDAWRHDRWRDSRYDQYDRYDNRYGYRGW
jgi:hypothetical protein